MSFNTTRFQAAIFVFIGSLVAFSVSAEQLSEQNLKDELKKFDTYSTEETISIYSNLQSDYAYPPINKCFAEKLLPLESQRGQESYIRNGAKFKIECNLQYFKQDKAFQKKADIDARRKTTRILSPSADEISEADAQLAVNNAMNTIPKNKAYMVLREVRIKMYYWLRSKGDYENSRKFEGGEDMTPDQIMAIGNPVEVYRIVKRQILLTNIVWPASTTVSLP